MGRAGPGPGVRVRGDLARASGGATQNARAVSPGVGACSGGNQARGGGCVLNRSTRRHRPQRHARGVAGASDQRGRC